MLQKLQIYIIVLMIQQSLNHRIPGGHTIFESTNTYLPPTYDESDIFNHFIPQNIVYNNQPHRSHNLYINNDRNLVNFNHFGRPFPTQITSNDLSSFLDSYIADGRILKQYSVIENQDDDKEFEIQRNSLFLTPQNSQSNNNIGGQGTRFTSVFRQFEDDLNNFNVAQPTSPTNTAPLTFTQNDQNNQRPIALGSGSLGYIRLPNGQTYLGSGSLGYISQQKQQQQSNPLQQTFNVRRTSQPGPLSFGHDRR